MHSSAKSPWKPLHTILANHLGILNASFWTGLHPWRQSHSNKTPIHIWINGEIHPMFKAWIQGILDARSLLPSPSLWAHEPIRHYDHMYPDLPLVIVNPTSLRHKLGMFTPTEWSSIPRLYHKQIANTVRPLARINTETLHDQWLLRNESITDKEAIINNGCQKLRKPRRTQTPRSVDRLTGAIQRNKRRERAWEHTR